MGNLSESLNNFINSHRKLCEYTCNFTLAAFYLYFDYRLLTDFIHTHRISSALLVIFETAIVFFSLTRPLPEKTNTSLYDWFIALAGTTIIILLRPAAQVEDNIILLVVQLLGMMLSLTGLFSLNKSWGLVAANRGIRSSGMYRFVRHPIYAGYFISFGCFVAQNMTAYNVFILTFFVALEILRIHAEEDLLSQDAAYIAYKKSTRWRVIPFIY